MRSRVGASLLVAAIAVAMEGQGCGGDGANGARTGGSSAAQDSSGQGSARQSSAGQTSATSGASGSSSAVRATSGASGASSASSGARSTSGSSGSSSAATSGGSCLGSSLLTALGKQHLLVGVSASNDSTGNALVASAPFDLRYEYLSGGLFDGASPCASCATGCTASGHTCANSAGQGGCAWWGCYQYDMNPPGEFVRDFDTGAAAASPVEIPMFTYYEILQTAQATISNFKEGTAEATTAATNQGLMTRYFADWRFVLTQIGTSTAILHIEPDFWGYAEQAGTDPTALPAAVASANATDCASMPNTIAGMGQCMIAMARKYAPHALVGLHASAWASNVDVALNTNASLDVAGEAKKVATFLAASGEANADLVIVETSDRDSGYYASIGRNTVWDATNATLPDFHQDFAWVKALTEALGKPALYWQTPLGNASQNETTNHWTDDRVDYFFGHMSELAAAHAIGVAYGAGAGDQTLPTTDSGNLASKTQAYSAAGSQSLCF